MPNIPKADGVAGLCHGKQLRAGGIERDSTKAAGCRRDRRQVPRPPWMRDVPDAHIAAHPVAREDAASLVTERRADCEGVIGGVGVVWADQRAADLASL